MANEIDILQQYGKYFQPLYEEIPSEGGKNHPHFIFACHAVFPSLLTSDLLYQIWYNFRTYTLNSNPGELQSIPFEAVNDFLHSDLCREVGPDQYKVDHRLRADLLSYLDAAVDGNRTTHLAFFLEKYGEYNQDFYYQNRIRDLHKDTADVTLYPEKALQKYRQSLKTTLEGPGNKSLGLVKLKMRLEQHASLREDFQELNNLVGYSLNAISGKKQDQFVKLDYLSSNEAEGIFVAEELLGGINKLIDKSYQDLTEFPYELFEDPDKIISLDLSHNHISKLPPELGQLSNLEYLNLNDNPGLYIYDVDWARLENLRELKLNRLDLVEVPPVLFYCPQLEKLELYRNQLTHIPEIEGANYSLRHLDLSHNQLGYLPSWMYHLSGLEYLYLEDNRLEALSEEIYGLSNLKVLHLKDNALRQLPESIKALTALQSNNQGKYFQNGFTIEGNAFDFKLPKELLNDDPEKIIDFILAQQVEVIGEVEDKRSKSKETEEIIEEEEPKPVIFLAYANQIDHSRHLRNLAQEMRDVRKSLSPVVRTGSVEIVERVDATIDDIVDVFQDPLYSGRIAIFHYGGHAESYSFLLEESGAEKLSFGRFLANQEGLKMVFLSGCGSERHARELTQQGVSMVVSTFDTIADNIAHRFAVSFYRGISEYVSIEEAFREAEGMVLAMSGSDSRNLYVEGAFEKGSDFPWRIYSADETNLRWRLPDDLDQISDKKAVSPNAYLFCDRVEQVNQFRDHVRKRLLDSERHPIPVIVHGPNEELPHSMVERLKLEYQSVLINPEKTVFPDRFHSGEIEIRKEFFLNGGARFYQRIEDQFRKAFDLEKFAPEELIRRHRNNKSIFITHSIFGTLSKGEIDIFTNYINRFWSIHLSKQDPDIILFLVFTDLKEDTGGILNIFRSDPFQKMIDNLNINQGITLSRLSPVSREDVAVWQRENLQERTDLVNKIFGNKKELPMNVIQPLLRKAIEDKGNRKGKMK